MLSHFDDLLLTTATDGASATIGASTSMDAPDVDQLMDAWYRERQLRIEEGLFLDRAKQILNRIILEGEINSGRKRQVERLLLAIKEAGKGRGGDGS